MNLDTADTIVKLVLALLIVVFYFGHVVSGPLALLRMVLVVVVLLISLVKAVLVFMTKD
jgi:hypothetical protein